MDLERGIAILTQLPGLRPVQQYCKRVQARRLRGLILSKHRHSKEPEIQELLGYLQRHPALDLPLFVKPPCEFMHDLSPDQIRVFDDPEQKMSYVIVNGHRIYYPYTMNHNEIAQRVYVALTEQHAGSPHEYLSKDFTVSTGDVGVFAGASDGIFALSVIERLSRAFLFEPEQLWHNSLRATTRPWAHKIEIVPRYLGAQDDDRTITLDSFMSTRGEVNYLQADVEGAEYELLRGAARTIRTSRRIKASICCYHKRDDEKHLREILESYGMKCAYSRGYFIMGLRDPYLWRGVIRADKEA